MIWCLLLDLVAGLHLSNICSSELITYYPGLLNLEIGCLLHETGMVERVRKYQRYLFIKEADGAPIGEKHFYERMEYALPSSTEGPSLIRDLDFLESGALDLLAWILVGSATKECKGECRYDKAGDGVILIISYPLGSTELTFPSDMEDLEDFVLFSLKKGRVISSELGEYIGTPNFLVQSFLYKYLTSGTRTWEFCDKVASILLLMRTRHESETNLLSRKFFRYLSKSRHVLPFVNGAETCDPTKTLLKLVYFLTYDPGNSSVRATDFPPGSSQHRFFLSNPSVATIGTGVLEEWSRLVEAIFAIQLDEKPLCNVLAFLTEIFDLKITSESLESLLQRMAQEKKNEPSYISDIGEVFVTLTEEFMDRRRFDASRKILYDFEPLMDSNTAVGLKLFFIIDVWRCSVTLSVDGSGVRFSFAEDDSLRGYIDHCLSSGSLMQKLCGAFGKKLHPEHYRDESIYESRDIVSTLLLDDPRDYKNKLEVLDFMACDANIEQILEVVSRHARGELELDGDIFSHLIEEASGELSYSPELGRYLFEEGLVKLFLHWSKKGSPGEIGLCSEESVFGSYTRMMKCANQNEVFRLVKRMEHGRDRKLEIFLSLAFLCDFRENEWVTSKVGRILRFASKDEDCPGIEQAFCSSLRDEDPSKAEHVLATARLRKNATKEEVKLYKLVHCMVLHSLSGMRYRAGDYESACVYMGRANKIKENVWSLSRLCMIHLRMGNVPAYWSTKNRMASKKMKLGLNDELARMDAKLKPMTGKSPGPEFKLKSPGDAIKFVRKKKNEEAPNIAEVCRGAYNSMVFCDNIVGIDAAKGLRVADDGGSFEKLCESISDHFRPKNSSPICKACPQFSSPRREDPAAMLFNGNLLLHEDNAIHSLLLILLLRINFPRTFFVNRGAHECLAYMLWSGLFSRLREEYRKKGGLVWRDTLHSILDVFSSMPFAVVADKKLIMSSGMAYHSVPSIGDLQRLERRVDHYSDPSLYTVLLPHHTGDGFFSGTEEKMGIDWDTARRFCERNGLNGVVVGRDDFDLRRMESEIPLDEEATPAVQRTDDPIEVVEDVVMKESVAHCGKDGSPDAVESKGLPLEEEKKKDIYEARDSPRGNPMSSEMPKSREVWGGFTPCKIHGRRGKYDLRKQSKKSVPS
jgi:hypothetical protein